MNSQITTKEQGIADVFTPHHNAEYATLQQQIDEDALELIDVDSKIQTARQTIRQLQDQKKVVTARRRRNVERKRIALQRQFDMLMVDEQ